jgi:hypothetical protein
VETLVPQDPAVWAARDHATGLVSFDRPATFVYGSVMERAEAVEVGEIGGPAVHPVLAMVDLSAVATGGHTRPIPSRDGTAESCGDPTRPPADVERRAIGSLRSILGIQAELPDQAPVAVVVPRR